MSFFQSLIPYFKKLDSIQKLQVRNKFQNILIEELSSIREPALIVSNTPVTPKYMLAYDICHR